MNEGYLVRSLLHRGIVSKKLQVTFVVIRCITLITRMPLHL